MERESNIDWIDRGTYWLSPIKQGTPLWDGQRKYRLTASNFGTAAGHNHFKTPEQLADEMVGIKEVVIPDKNRKLMDYGTRTEPTARDWYSRNRGVLVKEVGHAVWKENAALGCSTDGIVMGGYQDPKKGPVIIESDLLIEIKSIQKMYQPLINHNLRVKDGFVPPRFYHDHMWPTHYDQIQGNLAIMNKKACDYIVYCAPENNVFTYRVEFDPGYWNQDLCPALTHFITDLLNPRLERLGIRRQDPPTN